jgi:hypothetical protein
MVGAVPVGIQTRDDEDVPYWPPNTCYNWKEIWVHPAEKWLAVMADLAAPARVEGHAADIVELTNAQTGQAHWAAPSADGRFKLLVAAGTYRVRHGPMQTQWTLVAGEQRRVDLRRCAELTIAQEQADEGPVVIRVTATGAGPSRIELRTSNLDVGDPVRLVQLQPDKPRAVEWRGAIRDPGRPWLAVAVADGNVAGRCAGQR